MKLVDDRPLPIWRMSIAESDPPKRKPCMMQDAPLSLFICTQVDKCKLPCIQKRDQKENSEYVEEQQVKINIRLQKVLYGNRRTDHRIHSDEVREG